jgi:hypothetical protein
MLKKRWRLILPVGILAALFVVTAIQGRAITQPPTTEATTQVGIVRSDAWLSNAEVAGRRLTASLPRWSACTYACPDANNEPYTAQPPHAHRDASPTAASDADQPPGCPEAHPQRRVRDGRRPLLQVSFA